MFLAKNSQAKNVASEEFSGEECSDEEYSDEECSDKECSDEESSSEEFSGNTRTVEMQRKFWTRFVCLNDETNRDQPSKQVDLRDDRPDYIKKVLKCFENNKAIGAVRLRPKAGLDYKISTAHHNLAVM
jgi:hypothetical protein